jgi:hypothetical protein
LALLSVCVGNLRRVATAVLTDRALNRALLVRQGLLKRWDCSALEAIERLVGMQSQSPNAPYVGLWSRLEQFHPDELSKLMLARTTVRIPLMRSTIFLVSATDARTLRPVIHSCISRGAAAFTRGRTEGLDMARVVRLGRSIVEEKPRTTSDLGKLVAAEFSGYDSKDLEHVLRAALALVQVTPRGVWGRSHAAHHTTLEHWTGQSMGTADRPDDAIRRYLAAFGPAAVSDIQTWSGLQGIRPQVERLRPTLRTFVNQRGQELLDVPDGLLPDPETPVPVRILAEFDNILLSHTDRARIFADQQRSRFMTINGLVRSTYLIDGFVRGTCALTRQKSTATLTFTPFARLRKKDETRLAAEGHRLLAFAAGGAASHQIQFDPNPS